MVVEGLPRGGIAMMKKKNEALSFPGTFSSPALRGPQEKQDKLGTL